MRVPRAVLRETILVRLYQGEGARGALYADEKQIRAAFQDTSRLVADYNGQSVSVEGQLIIRPEDGPVPPDSAVTWGGQTFRVLQCYPMPDSRRPSHYALMVADFATGAGGRGRGGLTGSGS